jgi:hypothetical protein
MFLGKNISTDGQKKARKQTNANRLSKQTENKQKKDKSRSGNEQTKERE